MPMRRQFVRYRGRVTFNRAAAGPRCTKVAVTINSENPRYRTGPINMAVLCQHGLQSRSVLACNHAHVAEHK